MTPDDEARLEQIGRAAEFISRTVHDILDRSKAEKVRPQSPGPGRPAVRIPLEKQNEVLRLQLANGKLSSREIAKRVGMTRYQVERVLGKHPR